MKTIFNDLCIGVFASLWAIIQTFVHLWWILLGRFEYACPIHFDAQQSKFLYQEVFLATCNDALSIVSRNFVQEPSLTDNVTFHMNSTEEIRTASTILRFKLPSFSATTSDILMLVYIILDGLWIVTSVSLLLASCCRFKEKSSLYFYMPWVIIGTIIIGFDVYCSFYFGLNIPENWIISMNLNFITIIALIAILIFNQERPIVFIIKINIVCFFITTLLEWLENIGILDKRLPKIISQFKTNDSENNSGIGFRAPVFLMTLFTARIFFIWFINVLTVFAIFRIAQKVSGEKYNSDRGNHRHHHHHHKRSRREPSTKNTSHNTFEERVRNWQDFYGTLRENSSNDLKKKRTSITYLETSANSTELRSIDLSSYDSFRKGRVRIASENESSTDNETMNSTFKYGVPEETSIVVLGPNNVASGPGSPSAIESATGQGSTSGLAIEPGRHVTIVELQSRFDSMLNESVSRF